MTIMPARPLCHYGKKGCLEALASGYSVAASAIGSVKSSENSAIKKLVDGRINRISVETVTQAAVMGDVAAVQIIREAANYLGMSIANVTMLIGPELIIGSGLAKCGDIYFDEIARTIKELAFSDVNELPEIKPCLLGDDSSSVGAAAFSLMQIFHEKSETASPNTLHKSRGGMV
jgi:predicted NBD/HSP70 family sugar kinase